MSLVDGTIAPSGQPATRPPAALRIVSPQRLAPSLGEWLQPLVPRVWQALPADRRQAHERLGKSATAAAGHVRDLTARLAAQRIEDDRQLELAARKGRAPAPPLALAIERELEQAQQRERETVDAVHRSGRGLVADLPDSALQEAIASAKGEVGGLVTGIPVLLEQAISDLGRAGELANELSWVAGLLRSRRAGPYRPRRGAQPPGQHLSNAARLMREALAEIAEDDRERARRAAGPPEHARAQGFAPPPGTMVPGPITPAA